MNKKLLFIAIALLLMMFFVLLFAFLTKTPQPSAINTPNPTITLVPSPTPNPTDLFIQGYLPTQKPSEPYLTFQKITLTFSEEINPSDVKYEINPPTEIYIRGGESKKTIYLIPQTKWEIGTTTITILQATTSLNGKPLYRPFVYELITDIPPVPEGVFEIE